MAPRRRRHGAARNGRGHRLLHGDGASHAQAGRHRAHGRRGRHRRSGLHRVRRGLAANDGICPGAPRRMEMERGMDRGLAGALPLHRCVLAARRMDAGAHARPRAPGRTGGKRAALRLLPPVSPVVPARRSGFPVGSRHRVADDREAGPIRRRPRSTARAAR
jgi:hypothetical protein